MTVYHPTTYIYHPHSYPLPNTALINLLLTLNPNVDISSRTLGHTYPYKSWSRPICLTFLLLLLLVIFPLILALNFQHFTPMLGTLIPNSISLLLRPSLFFSCALWNAYPVCNKLNSVHDLLAITETWIIVFDSSSPVALSHGGLQLTYTSIPSG